MSFAIRRVQKSLTQVGEALTIILCALLVAPPTLTAQNIAGTLSGKVQDSSGEAVPGVVIEVSSDQLLGVRSAVTDAGGRFRIPRLPPGQYTVTATLEGFAVVQTGAHLGVGQSTDITLTLDVGPVPLDDPIVVRKPGKGRGGGKSAPAPEDERALVVEARSFEDEIELQDWLDAVPGRGMQLESVMPLQTGLALLVLRKAPESEIGSYTTLRIDKPFRQKSLKKQLSQYPAHRFVGVQTLDKGYLLILVLNPE